MEGLLVLLPGVGPGCGCEDYAAMEPPDREDAVDGMLDAVEEGLEGLRRRVPLDPTAARALRCSPSPEEALLALLGEDPGRGGEWELLSALLRASMMLDRGMVGGRC